MKKFYIVILSLLFSLTALQAEELVNEKLRDGNVPASWTSQNVEFLTAAQGYAKILGGSGILSTPTYDWSNYENIEIKFEVAKFGSGTDGPITVDISTDGGSTWGAFSENSSVPSSSTYLPATINIPNTVPLTNAVKVRFTAANSPSDKRFRDLIITGDAKALGCDAPTGSFTYSANPACQTTTVLYTSGYYFQDSPEGTSTEFPTSSPYTLSTTGKVYVRNLDGACWSNAVASDDVVIHQSAVINSQPQDIIISIGQTGTLSVDASNASAYQWQRNTGSSWQNISGATSSTYNISSPSLSMDGYQYRVIVIGQSPCANLTSNPVTLTVTKAMSSIWSNTISGTNPNTDNPFVVGDNSVSGISVSGIGRSSGILGTNANNRYNTNSWDSETLDGDKYITWTISAEAGNTFSVGSLDLNLRRSSTGPNKIQVRMSADGFSSQSDVDYTSTSNSVPFTFNILAMDQTQLEVRLYGYGASSAQGTLGVVSFDFNGYITPLPASGPCYTPNNLNASVQGKSVTFTWFGNSNADIHAIKLKNVNEGKYSYAYSATQSGFQAQNLESGTYSWQVLSLCDTETLVTDNASGWIDGGTFTIP